MLAAIPEHLSLDPITHTRWLTTGLLLWEGWVVLCLWLPQTCTHAHTDRHTHIIRTSENKPDSDCELTWTVHNGVVWS